MTHQYKVEGMTCGNCQKHVEESLASLSEVKSVEVNLAKGEAVIDLEKHLTDEELQKSLGSKYRITQKSDFEAKDLNKIKKKVDALLQRKIEQSQLKDNAKNRLISELQKIYFLTSSMGWSLHYNAQEVESDTSLENLMWQNFTKID